MAEFTPSKKIAQDFNNGIKYINEEDGIAGDAIQAEAINNLVESNLYTQIQAENAVNTANNALERIENVVNTGDTPPPVGFHYIQFFGEPTPAQRYAGTSWIIDIDYAGRTIIGSGGKYIFGATDGEETHTLTRDEMPAHRHSLTVNADNPDVSGLTQDYIVLDYFTRWKIFQGNLVQPEGGSQSHNNMPPYIVNNYWKRTP